MWSQIAGFFGCAAIIFFAGKRLSFYGDKLAELTGLGKAWIGLVLMATVTSLPELMVGINSSAVLRSADLAVGDVIGSCAVNLGILSVLDIFSPRKIPLFNHVSRGQILAAAFAIISLTLVGLVLFLGKDIRIFPSLGMTSVIIALVYFVSLKVLHAYQLKNPVSETAAESDSAALSLKRVIIAYIFFATLIVVSASALPHFADQISAYSGLSRTFVGTLFLAVSTSLPEIAVSFAAVRAGSVDIAVGNLLGSNVFNVFILFIDDAFYSKGILLQDASKANMISVFFTIIMTALAIIGITFPAAKKRILMATDAFIILCLYVINVIVLYNYVP